MTDLYDTTSFVFVPEWNEYLCDGCGVKFWRHPSRAKKDKYRNVIRHFCSRGCRSLLHPGYNFKGGRWKDKSGYIIVLAVGHPFARSHRYICEHRLVMEKKLGRYLLPTESVHHINGIRDDNRIENLELRVEGTHPNGISINDMIIVLRQAGYIVIEP